MRLCQEGHQHLDEGLLASAARLQQEHAAQGKHALRVMRRAERLSAGMADGAAGEDPCDSAAASNGSRCVLQAEVEVSQLALQPCGGAIFVQLTASSEVLSSHINGSPCTDTPSEAPSEAAGSDPAQWQSLMPCATAIVQQLVGPAAGGGCATHAATIKAANADDALLHCSKPPMSPFRAPPAASSDKAHRFMRLEPLQLFAGDMQRMREESLQPVAGVLHAHKKAQHLLLRFSWRQAEPPAKRWQGLPSPSQGAEPCRSAALGSGWWFRSAAASVVDHLSAFCREANAGVVALDAHVHSDRVDATWVLHAGGLAELERAQLAATINTHFPSP
jgi:hypothetical protein